MYCTLSMQVCQERYSLEGPAKYRNQLHVHEMNGLGNIKSTVLGSDRRSGRKALKN